MKGSRKIVRVLAVLLVARLAALPAPLPTNGPSGVRSFSAPPPDAAARRSVAVAAYGRLPMAFEANRGQTDPQVQFLARGRGYTLFLTAQGAVMVLRPPQRQEDVPLRAPGIPALGRASLPTVRTSVVRMTLIGANPSATMSGLDRLPGKVNYFIGNDPKKWRTNIPTYARVRSRGVYPGVDLVYYVTERQLEYDLEVAPAGDPSNISIDFEGVDRLDVDAGGDLLLHMAGGQIRQHRPLVYQEIDGIRQQIAGGYVLRGPHEFGFQVAAYDATRPLIIDPVLTYSTYLGGNGNDGGTGIAVDASGNAYVTGFTASSNFPTMNPVQAANAGQNDVFVTKLNAAGSALVYSTYLGGSNSDVGYGIAVDGSGNAYVTGQTDSTNFPTMNPIQATNAGFSDAFVTKLNAAGSALIYSTYLGGSNSDTGYGIAVASSGSAYVTGQTASTNFPTANPFQAANAGGSTDAFVTKLNAAGSALIYSTYLGGSGDEIGYGIAVDSSGNAYVTGYTNSTNFPTMNPIQAANAGGPDVFVTKLNAAGAALVYSTYLGGSNSDTGYGIAVDGAGNAYVTGQTDSPNFPTMNPFQAADAGFLDAFVTKVNATGSALVYSSYLGGGARDVGHSIAADSAGNAYVAGDTSSSNFPTANPVQAANAGGFSDAFVTKVSPSGSALVYSTYLGGSSGDNGYGIAVDTWGSAYVIGTTCSSNFPTVSPFQPTLGGLCNAFLARLGASVTVGLYSPATSTFYLKNANSAGPADMAFGYGPGAAGWMPLAGDWTGTGVTTVGLYNPTTSTFYLRNSNSAGPADTAFNYGPAAAGWMPLVGDWTGTGRKTVGLYNPTTSTFYLRNSNTPGPADQAFQFGPAGAGWLPVVGDWDGNGTDTVGLYNPATGTFFLRNSNSAGPADLTFGYGPAGAGWQPLVGHWNGGRAATVGLYNPATSVFYLRNSNSAGAADIAFGYGPAGSGWSQLAGDWDGS